jgi:outer membrane protein
MRRILVALALPLALLAARTAHAQSVKLGYVDVQRAVQEVDEGKNARTRLKAELDERRGQIEKKKTDLEKLKADFDKQASVLSDEAKRKKMGELQAAFMDAQESGQKMQDDLTGKEQEAMGSISRRMIQIVGEVSEKEQFSFVMDKAILLYAPPASDLTNEVVRRYNERFPGTKSAAPEGKPAGGKAVGGDKKAAPKK